MDAAPKLLGVDTAVELKELSELVSAAVSRPGDGCYREGEERGGEKNGNKKCREHECDKRTTGFVNSVLLPTPFTSSFIDCSVASLLLLGNAG